MPRLRQAVRAYFRDAPQRRFNPANRMIQQRQRIPQNADRPAIDANIGHLVVVVVIAIFAGIILSQLQFAKATEVIGRNLGHGNQSFDMNVAMSEQEFSRNRSFQEMGVAGQVSLGLSKFDGADLYCFKNKTEPKWEDPLFANGGKWTMAFPKAKSDSCWLNTFDHGDFIRGVLENVSRGWDEVSIWTKNAANESAQAWLQMSIGKQWKEFIDYNDTIGFIFHERSVSTILYHVSLKDLKHCPFRVVDEINQGMDPINERQMFRQLVRPASQPNTPQCFLLTPKLLSALEFGEACTILTVVNGPWIKQPSEVWKFGGSWGSVMGKPVIRTIK